jgi:hypothetical protein
VVATLRVRGVKEAGSRGREKRQESKSPKPLADTRLKSKGRNYQP